MIDLNSTISLTALSVNILNTSIRVQRLSNGDFKKARLQYMLCTQKTHFENKDKYRQWKKDTPHKHYTNKS